MLLFACFHRESQRCASKEGCEFTEITSLIYHFLLRFSDNLLHTISPQGNEVKEAITYRRGMPTTIPRCEIDQCLKKKCVLSLVEITTKI